MNVSTLQHFSTAVATTAMILLSVELASSVQYKYCIGHNERQVWSELLSPVLDVPYSCYTRTMLTALRVPEHYVATLAVRTPQTVQGTFTVVFFARCFLFMRPDRCWHTSSKKQKSSALLDAQLGRNVAHYYSSRVVGKLVQQVTMIWELLRCTSLSPLFPRVSIYIHQLCSLSRPVAFINSGSFAHQPPQPSPPVTPGSSRQKPTTHPLDTNYPIQSPPATRQPTTAEPFDRALPTHHPQPQPSLPSSAQDLFARPSQTQQPLSGSDPLSHLLQDGVQSVPDGVGVDIVQSNTQEASMTTRGKGVATVGAYDHGKTPSAEWSAPREVRRSTVLWSCTDGLPIDGRACEGVI